MIMRKRQRQWLVGTLCSGPPLGQLARHQQCVRVQGSAYIALNLIQYVTDNFLLVMRTVHLLVLGHLAHHEAGNSAIEWTYTIWCAVNGTICATLQAKSSSMRQHIKIWRDSRHIADNIAMDNTATYYAHYYLFAYSAYLHTWCLPRAEVTCTRGSLVAKGRRPCWPQSAHLQPAACKLLLMYFLVYFFVHFLVC